MKPFLARLFRFTLIVSLISPLTSSADLVTGTNLNEEQRRTLLIAKQDSRELRWRVFSLEVDGRPRTAVFLGEHHWAFAEDLRAAQRPIDQFQYFATENGGHNSDPSWDWRTLPVAAHLMAPWAAVIRLFSRRTEYSPMRLPQLGRHTKSVRSAERYHRPTLGEEIDLMIVGIGSFALFATVVVAAHTGVHLLFDVKNTVYLMRFGRAALTYLGLDVASRLRTRFGYVFPVVKNRDRSISKYVDAWIRNASDDTPLMVILGKSHLHNCAKFLTSDYGFHEIALEAAAAL